MADYESWVSKIDNDIKQWRQGDCTLSDNQFIYRYDPEYPLTQNSKKFKENHGDDKNIAIADVKGFVVVSQTCDIVPQSNRTSADRPFVEVIPLIEIEALLKVVKNTSKEDFLEQVRRGQRLQYLYVPGVKDLYLVGDLDRVMTIEKSVVARWERIAGCTTDREAKELGKALARKRERFAFPDDFVAFVKKLQSRMKDKHEKNSPEGEALRALREIRVNATPSWQDNEINLFFWFIREEEDIQFEGKGWYVFLKQWLDLVPVTGRFKDVDGQVTTLEDMTGGDYVYSDPLALDYLSSDKEE